MRKGSALTYNTYKNISAASCVLAFISTLNTQGRQHLYLVRKVGDLTMSVSLSSGYCEPLRGRGASSQEYEVGFSRIIMGR